MTKSFVPDSSDLASVFALLEIIANPDAARQRLAEINDAAGKLEETRKAIEAAQDRLDSEKDAFAQTVAQQTADLAARKREAEEAQAEAAKRNEVYDARARRIEEHEKELSQLQSHLTMKEANLTARETEAEKNLIDASVLYDKGLALQTEYEEKLAKLRAVAA